MRSVWRSYRDPKWKSNFFRAIWSNQTISGPFFWSSEIGGPQHRRDLYPQVFKWSSLGCTIWGRFSLSAPDLRPYLPLQSQQHSIFFSRISKKASALKLSFLSRIWLHVETGRKKHTHIYTFTRHQEQNNVKAKLALHFSYCFLFSIATGCQRGKEQL